MTPTHGSDPDNGEADEVWHALQAANVVLGRPALQDGHQAVENASLFGAANTGPIEVNGAGDPLKDQITVSGDLRLHTEVHRGEPPPGVGCAQVQVVF
jgi:hypothetical protein